MHKPRYPEERWEPAPCRSICHAYSMRHVMVCWRLHLRRTLIRVNEDHGWTTMQEQTHLRVCVLAHGSLLCAVLLRTAVTQSEDGRHWSTELERPWRHLVYCNHHNGDKTALGGKLTHLAAPKQHITRSHKVTSQGPVPLALSCSLLYKSLSLSLLHVKVREQPQVSVSRLLLRMPCLCLRLTVRVKQRGCR